MAILLDEPDASAMAGALVLAEQRRMSAANWLETCMNVDRRGVSVASARLEQARQQLRIEVVPFDLAMAEIARDAFCRYGRGSQHPAKLNFGDCMAYALAKLSGEPLLFKGDDFSQTDIVSALA